MAVTKKTTPEAQGEAPEAITPVVPVENIQDVVKNEEQSKDAPEAQGEAPEVNEVVSNIQPSVEITNEAKTIGENGGPASIVSVEFDIPESVSKAPKDAVIKVLIKYPENYKGNKFFKDGDIKHVIAVTAKIFIKKGIGTIIE